MRELRCGGNKLHGLVVDEDGPARGVLEVKCDSRFCGREAGVVVLHRFDLSTGEFNTRKYSEPNHTRGGAYGAGNKPASIRSA